MFIVLQDLDLYFYFSYILDFATEVLPHLFEDV